MLISPKILPQLSSSAAKIYLALLSQLDQTSAIPRATAPIRLLTRLTSLSERSCHYALRRLKDLKIIRLADRKFHAPHTYILLPPTESPPAAPAPANLNPLAPDLDSLLQSIATANPSLQPLAASNRPNLQSVAVRSTITPVPAPRKPNLQIGRASCRERV